MRFLLRPNTATHLLLALLVVMAGAALIQGAVKEADETEPSKSMPIRLAVSEPEDLNRPAVLFDHLKHTKALENKVLKDCESCHPTRKNVEEMTVSQVIDFSFPKRAPDASTEADPMLLNHQACVSCHRDRHEKGKKTGPDIGLCGECHVRKPAVEAADFDMDLIFNYETHHKHVEALSKISDPDDLNVADNLISNADDPKRSSCKLCHHMADESGKKLIYKINTENACGKCHKDNDEKNVRSLKKAAHAACVGCHMELRKRASGGSGVLKLADTGQTIKPGPFECSGCHGEKARLPEKKIAQIPRLMRGQKDLVDISLKDPKTGRMKVVSFNHKLHEKQGQFCNSCHHHSLEKCSNCHTPQARNKESGGVTFEAAYHKLSSNLSCAGCHEEEKASTQCSGCHHTRLNEVPKSSCPVCHSGPSKKNDSRKDDSGQVATPRETPSIRITGDKDELPKDVEIKVIANEFKPSKFPHKKIVLKLAKISNENTLASAFHARMGQQAVCSGCHHMTDPQASQKKKVPRCITCHKERTGNTKDLGRPGILGAYHQQCVGCHQAMKQKPLSSECEKCHKENKAGKGPILDNPEVRVQSQNRNSPSGG